jgi:type I restriction enzyme, S subunit
MSKKLTLRELESFLWQNKIVNFAVVAEDDVPCLLNQRVGRFQFVGEDLSPEYLKLVIQSASFLDPIFLAATSTAQFNVSPSQVGAIMLALPPVSEQNQIVNEVARRNIGLNEARDRTFTSIDRLKEYRSALITAAVTGQIDVTTYAKSGTPDRQLDAIQEEMGA